MPLFPPRRCSSCSRLVTGRGCPSCRQSREARRPSASQRGYLLPAWRRLRAAKLRHAPRCSSCGQPATDVDHLERHTGPSDPRFWAWSNLDSKCHRCHSRKTATQDSGFTRRAG